MIDDLAMLANLPVVELSATAKEKHDLDKAAAGETMPAPKRKRTPARATKAGRIARRGQDPPAPERKKK